MAINKTTQYTINPDSIPVTTSTGTQTLSGALDKRTIYVGSVAEMEALSLPVGTNVYLTEDGRAGEFVVKTGTPPSDPQKGIYIVLANGNYAERQYNRFKGVDVDWFGADFSGATDSTTAIKAAIEFGGIVNIVPKQGLPYLYTSQNPAIASTGLVIKGASKDIKAVLMGGDVTYGGYQFLTQNGPVSDVTVRDLFIDGQGIIATSTSPVNDTGEAIPAQLIDLIGCDNTKIINVRVDSWNQYHNLEDRHGIIDLSDCENPHLENFTANNCFGEQVNAHNTAGGRFLRCRCANTTANKIFTALNQIPNNATDDVTTASNNTIDDWFVDGANGSAMDIGGIGVYVNNIRWINSAKGINLNNEQFAGTPALPHDKIEISNVSGICNGSAGYGVLLNAYSRNVTMNNVQVKNANGDGIRVDNVVHLTGSNWVADGCVGASSIRVTGYIDGSSIKLGIAKLSNLISTGYNSVSGVDIRSFKRATVQGLDIANTNLSITPNDNISIRGLYVANYEAYANYGIRFQPGAHSKVFIDGFDFQPSDASTFSFPHVSVASGTTVAAMWLTNGEFGYTSHSYSISIPDLTKFYHSNVEHVSGVLLYTTSYDATLQVTPNSGVNTWRVPVGLGNGYLWIDSTGNVRTKATYPTGDVDGVVVGTQT